MIIIGTGLTFTLFIIALCFYGVIFGALLFLAVTIFPLIFIICPIWGTYDDYKRSKKGEIPPLTEVNYVVALIEIGISIWFLVKITIPFLQEVVF